MDFVSSSAIYFFIYAVLGWICEIVYCSVLDKKFQNRGFLYGPYCPIYGFGALIIIRVLLPLVDHPIYLFMTSMIVCSVLEYITSWVMEKAFHLRWWDYSNNKFNIQGRVCLLNSTLFGVLGLVVIYGIHPFVVGWVSKIPVSLSVTVSGLIVAGIGFDFVCSVLSVLRTSKQLQELRVSFDAYRAEQKIKREQVYAEWDKFVENLRAVHEERRKKVKSAFAEKLYNQLQQFDMRDKKFRRIVNNQSRMKLHGLESVLGLLNAYREHSVESEPTEMGKTEK